MAPGLTATLSITDMPELLSGDYPPRRNIRTLGGGAEA